MKLGICLIFKVVYISKYILKKYIYIENIYIIF